MAIKNFNGLRTQSIFANGSGDTYNVNKNASILVNGSVEAEIAAIYDKPTAKNNTFNIAGTVVGGQVGIYTQGKGAEINVGVDGQVIGAYGVAVAGDNATVNNKGTIIGSLQFALYAIDAGNLRFVNDGVLSGAAGMYVASGAPVKMQPGSEAAGDGNAVLINGAKGVIVAAEYGIAVDSETGDLVRIFNHGLIKAADGDQFAIGSGDGNEKVVNDGRLVGSVLLGFGNDSFDNRGGTITGLIAGDDGNDVLITDSAKVRLTEAVGEGTADAVKSTVTYTLSDNVEKLFLLGQKAIDGTGTGLDDILHGNAGNNVLKGLAGMDHLYGHKGNDRLAGGADVDYFHFSTGDGDDVITDFADTIDQIDLSGWAAIASFNDLLNNHARNQGADVIIEAGSDSLLIKGIHKADLDAIDFFAF
jgi:Ca2+-binding RTX toxin-like protein